MQLVKRDSLLWFYLSSDIRELIETGEIVLSFVHEHSEKADIDDYSFLVFSFAKAYEGFLKKLFLDMNLIREHEYYGDEIRIGRILNPYFTNEKVNVFTRICDHPKGGKELSNHLWNVWKRGRNLVFHYFPHNYRKLTYVEAYTIIEEIIDAMNTTVGFCIHAIPANNKRKKK